MYRRATHHFCERCSGFGIDIGTINRITGHVGDIREYRRTAIGSYIKFNADQNREKFEFINDVMLDVEPRSDRAGTT